MLGTSLGRIDGQESSLYCPRPPAHSCSSFFVPALRRLVYRANIGGHTPWYAIHDTNCALFVQI